MTFVLIYHDLALPSELETVGFPGPLAARYKLDPGTFEAHLRQIADAGVSVGLIEVDGVSGGSPAAPEPDAALTFDDGGASALVAASAIERFGWRGHFFITTGRIGTPGFLDAGGVRELVARGHAVGSHSHSHPTYMGRLSACAIAQEWRRSRQILGEMLGEPPLTASVPGGFLSRAVIQGAQRSGLRLLMTSEPEASRRRHGELALQGRYTIWSSTPAPVAAAYATGARGARARLWLEWKAKGVAKRVNPGAYQRLRRVRAMRR